MRHFLCFCLAMMACLPTRATLTVGSEYYIWLNIYEKLLGTNEAGDGPALSAYGTKTDGYVFVAENSGKSGYVLLRQKSSGKYLAASGSNEWSVTLENKSTNDRFCWKTDAGLYTYIINKKNGKYLGIDGANKGSNYVSVYYDKPKGSHSQYSIIPVVGNSWNEARQAYVSAKYTNAQGVSEIDYCVLDGKTVDVSDAVDIHITANDKPIQKGSSVNLGSDHTWLIIDNIIPSKVISDYLKYVTINGAPAQNGVNCRVAIYLNGAAVIPTPNEVMSCQGTDGSFTLNVGNNNNLGENNNTMTGFTLRRGYMATLASGTNGSGHSQVYVADHADLTVTLPEALDRRVSSVNIKPWQYLSKKGWGDKSGATKGPQLRATWYWTWSAGYNSTTDMEYVPCRQHRYWPGAAEVNDKTATASLSLNEPEHAEQHTSDKCSCGGTIDAWTAYGINKEFQAGGGRIGSPQPTDFSYLTKYFGYIDENNNESRCDFAVTHAYWDIDTRDEYAYATYVTDQCWTIWNNTHRPVWLTEMEVGASWFSSTDKRINSYDAARKYLQVLLQKLEECDYIERYAIYSFDFWRNKMFYDDGGITPAGQVYRDHRSTFAYHADKARQPAWWRPGLKTPTLQYETSASEIILLIGNDNGDVTESIVIERKPKGGSWQTMATITKRSELDPTTVRYAISPDQIDRFDDTFRVTVNTLYGQTAQSNELKMASYVSNGTIVAESKSVVPGWTCQRSAANGYTKGDSGDTYLEVWDSKAADMAFDYYQNVGALPPGIYQLSAVCFNSSNNVAGAFVNGNVGLYAQAEGVEYFAPVTTDSEIDYANPTVISQILVRSGTMRIGIKNQGPMTARWAGADNFELKYLGTEEEVLDGYAVEDFIKARLLERDNQLKALFIPLSNNQQQSPTQMDASVLIVNTDCNRSDTYGWTTDNLSTNKGQAWDGNDNNVYWDVWNANSLQSSMTQTVGYLPAGDYALSALLRCTTGQTITFKAVHQQQNGQEESFVETITGIGDATESGSTYQRGWRQVTLPTFSAKSGDHLIISASITTTATAWWSADHFTLSWNAPTVTAITTPHSTPVREGPGVGSPSGEADGGFPIYNLQGQSMGQAPLKPGLYIINNKKKVVR